MACPGDGRLSLTSNKLEAVAPKQRCAYAKCSKQQVDVKNSTFTAEKNKVDEEKCCDLRSHCKLVKFCCESHKNKCLSGKTKKQQKDTQGREALDVAQVVHLFQVLTATGSVWTAVLMLIHLYLGERADCVRRITRSWLSNLEPEASGVPSIEIPEGVNGKTKSRKVQLPPDFSSVLHGWMFLKPLRGGREGQWPFEGQCWDGPNSALFPGFDVSKNGHQSRAWQQPVTERAYLEALKRAAKIIIKERAAAREREECHVFEGVNMDLLGTHSLKKTHVTLMKTAGHSSAIVEAITGTQAATLDRYYDIVSPKRQAEAMHQVFQPVLQKCKRSDDESGLQGASRMGDEKSSFCTGCGRSVCRTWKFCCSCGTSLDQEN